MIRSLFSLTATRVPQAIKAFSCCNAVQSNYAKFMTPRLFASEAETVSLPSNLSVDNAEIFVRKEEKVMDPSMVNVKEMDVLPLFNPNYSGETKVILNNEIFGVPVREDIIHRVIVWQLAKKRAGNHKTKSRSEVSGSNRKILQQKGSGNARAGQFRSNIRRHGYKAMGAHLRDYDYTLPYRVRALGLRCALSSKWSEGLLTIISDTDVATPKSKDIVSILTKAGLIEHEFSKTPCLIIDGPEKNDNFTFATQNVPVINYLPCQGMNVFDIIKNKHLIITKKGLEAINKRLEPYL
ncbi:hypothetical protein WA158_008278 [Blastocystis sp. Blastoise]